VIRPITISNQTQQIIDQVDLSIADAKQDPNGRWVAVPIGDPNVDRSKMRSCAGWITVDKDSIKLNPLQQVSVNLTITIPPQTQGHYCAAALATALIKSTTADGPSATVSVSYIIPIIVEVQSRFLRDEVSLTGVGLQFDKAGYSTPAATMATFSVEDKGGTYCRLQGYLRVSYTFGGHWRRITECQWSDVGIIPGAQLVLKRDVGRPLAKGKYKLEGFLIVNGNRADQIDKEIDFAGDPRAMALRPDAILDFDPREAVIDSMPGSVRTGRIEVVNPTDEPVTVDVEATLPEHLGGVVTHDPNSGRQIPGEEFGCEKWVTVEPRQFKLAAYGHQNLLVKADIPPTATGLPNYYAIMNFKAKFPDGQVAGTAKERVCLLMRKAPGAPLLKETVQISQLAPTKCLVLARVTNVGTAHVVPGCHMAVVTADQSVVARVEMSSEAYGSGNLLPLETRNFSGVLDISAIPAGTYVLVTVLTGEKMQPVQLTNGLVITEANGTKTAKPIGADTIGWAIKGNF
jgi:hypothetical protein